MKKGKKVKSKKVKDTHIGIVHKFANGIITGSTNYSTTNVSIDGNNLYYGTRIIAKIYSRRKHIVFIDSSFNNNGGWSRLSYWDITRCFDSEKWKIIGIDFNTRSSIYGYSQIYIPVSTNSANLKEGFFKGIISQYVDKIITLKSYADDVIYGKHMSFYRTNNIINIQNEFRDIQELLNIPNKLLNCIIKEHITSVIKYKGWNKYYDDTYLKDFKPKEYLIDYKLSEEELHIIERKNWIHNWIYKTYKGSILTAKEKIALYEDETARKAWEKRKVEIDKESQEYARIRRDRENEKKRLEEKERLDKWLLYESGGSHYHRRLYYSAIHLRFYPNDYTQIETTMGVTVPTTHAKILYRKFKQCVDTDTEFLANGNTISIGHYKVERISKETTTNKWYLKAGCHIIYKDQIDLFINSNKLDW